MTRPEPSRRQAPTGRAGLASRPGDVRAEVRLLRWLLRELYPRVSEAAPPELLDDVERALLRVAYDPQSRPITFVPGRHLDHWLRRSA